jgi:hypothetical protein
MVYQSRRNKPLFGGSSLDIADTIMSVLPQDGLGFPRGPGVWQEEARILLNNVLPILTYRRDYLNQVLDVEAIRRQLKLRCIIRITREPALPGSLGRGAMKYLHRLPGWIDDGFDEFGDEIPQRGRSPSFDFSFAREYHATLELNINVALDHMSWDLVGKHRTDRKDVFSSDIVYPSSWERMSDETAAIVAHRWRTLNPWHAQREDKRVLRSRFHIVSNNECKNDTGESNSHQSRTLNMFFAAQEKPRTLRTAFRDQYLKRYRRQLEAMADALLGPAPWDPSR